MVLIPKPFWSYQIFDKKNDTCKNFPIMLTPEMESVIFFILNYVELNYRFSDINRYLRFYLITSFVLIFVIKLATKELNKFKSFH